MDEITTIKIYLVGCDETNTVTMEVTPAELEFLDRLAAASITASEYDCMPRLAIGDGQLLALQGGYLKGGKTWPHR